MAITAITGKVGAGKNLYAIQRIMEYAFEGRRVVANFRLDLTSLQPMLQRLLGRDCPSCELLPGRPTYDDLRALGKGGPREHRSGLLVLDECGPLFNARTWQDKDRAKVIDWFLHSRKLAWDCLLIVQNIQLVDKQIRVAVIESCVTVRRMDRLRFLGVPLPRVHLAIERYGTEPAAPIARRSVFRGTRFFNAYDTTELVGEDLADSPEDGEAGSGEAAAPSPAPRQSVTVSPRAARDYADIGRFLLLDRARAAARSHRLRGRVAPTASTFGPVAAVAR